MEHRPLRRPELQHARIGNLLRHHGKYYRKAANIADQPCHI